MDAINSHGLPRDDGRAYGEARCPAPSVQQIVRDDPHLPPEVLAQESYTYLGSDDVDYERYYKQEFFDRELGQIWQKCWQWVCREDHIPEPGDYYVYEVADFSYLVVRQQDGSVKGFVNSCLHRGTKLKRTEGFSAGTSIRCPYHGWEWANDGALKAVPCAWDFPHVAADRYRLPQVRVGSWGGFLFINPSDEGPELLEYLAPLPEHFKAWGMEDRFVALHMAKELPCNWKMAQEAFLESYHVLETHPQLLAGVGDANVQYDLYGDHISRFYAALGVNSPHLAKPLTEQELVNQMLVGDRSVLDDDALKVGEGESARTVMARFLRKILGEKYDADLSMFSDSEVIDTIEYHVFPNMVIFPGISLPMVYRFRPIGSDPNRTLFELLFLRPKPANAQAPEPPDPVYVAEHESYASVPGMDAAMGGVYDQDTDNLRAQQQGIKAGRKQGQTLGNYQEVRIRHFNQTIDKYLNN